MIKTNSSNIVKILISISIFLIFYLSSPALILPIGSCFNPPAYAQSLNNGQELTSPEQYLKITPIISDLKLIPGQSTIIPLTIQNLSAQPVGIHADLSLLDEVDSSAVIKQVKSPLINWTTLSEKDQIVQPAEVKTINVIINTPKQTKSIGYYEAIFLTPFISQQRIPNKPVVLSRIGALVFATVGKLNFLI